MTLWPYDRSRTKCVLRVSAKPVHKSYEKPKFPSPPTRYQLGFTNHLSPGPATQHSAVPLKFDNYRLLLAPVGEHALWLNILQRKQCSDCPPNKARPCFCEINPHRLAAALAVAAVQNRQGAITGRLPLLQTATERCKEVRLFILPQRIHLETSSKLDTTKRPPKFGAPSVLATASVISIRESAGTREGKLDGTSKQHFPHHPIGGNWIDAGGLIATPFGWGVTAFGKFFLKGRVLLCITKRPRFGHRLPYYSGGCISVCGWAFFGLASIRVFVRTFIFFFFGTP